MSRSLNQSVDQAGQSGTLQLVPEPRVLEVIQEVDGWLRKLQEQLDANAAALRNGEMLAELYDISVSTIEEVYTVAYQLLVTKRFALGLPAAIWLASVKPCEARFHFIAASCLQQLGEHEMAARFYAQSLIMAGDDAASIFRLAECLWALGEKSEARKLFDTVVDLGRADSSLLELQKASQHRLTLH